LLAGTLSKNEDDQVSEHLEICLHCQRTLEGIIGGTDYSEMARELAQKGPASDPGLCRVIEEMKEQAASQDTRSEPANDIDRPLDFLDPSDKAGVLGRLGHYDIQEVIGRGGMGIVLKAFDNKLHRIVAIKVMAPHLAASPSARKRFTREAQAAAAIRNDHVVGIHAVEDAKDLPYLVMEYVSGESLQQRLDRHGPLELREILRIGHQTACGLAGAHAHGLIHRDIKPANILLENGVERVKITDFGLARAVDDASLSQSGVVAGTPQYMAPEQARGEPVDHRADLFSLGSVLYAMCTGRVPFRAGGSIAVLKRICEDSARPIREINPEIPDWLAALIGKLHLKDPADRFQSAAEMADLLGRHLAHVQHPSAASLPATTNGPSPRHVGVKGRRLAIAATVLVCLVAGLSVTEATGVTNVRTTVIRIFTPDGTLVVETDDPAVKVAIEGDGGVVITGAGPQEVRLRPGSYRVQASKDGKPARVDRDLVTITKNGRQVVRISQETAPLAEDDSDRRAAEFVTSIGGKIRVNNEDREFRDRELPRESFRLTYVDLRDNWRLSDEGLAHLKECKNLTGLVLDNTPVNDAGLASFKGCKQLTELWLRHTSVSDVGLASFKDCKSLTYLGLDDTRVSDAGLAYFKDCKNLRHLGLSNTQVGDTGLAYFKDCKKLTSLWLEGTQVSNAGLAYFKDRKDLLSLALGHTKVSDEGLGHFRGCKNLSELHLLETSVSDVGLAHFWECKKLTGLWLGDTQASDAGVTPFKACKNLTNVFLQRTKVTEAGIDALKKTLPRCRIEWDGGVIEPTTTKAKDAPKE
jgi:serine/threonine protein kinase